MSPAVVLDRRTGPRPAPVAARPGVPVRLARPAPLLGAAIATEDVQLNYLGLRPGPPARVEVEVKRDNRFFRECDLRLRVHAPGKLEPVADVVLDTTKWHGPALGSCYARQSVVLGHVPERAVFVVSDAGGSVLGRSRPIDLRSGAEVDDSGYDAPRIDLGLGETLAELKWPLVIGGVGLASVALIALLR